ncbi:MAG: type II secretion system F family protein, partial [Elusimicrobiales bacterium]|nr:type II secretion system F family protein [Elusimicrobiales bacterium]
IYTVQDAQGTVTTGAVDSEDEDSAVQSLQSKGLFILSIQSEAVKSKGILSLKKMGPGGKVSGREMVFFGEQMATLLGGGIPLVRALSLLSEHSENKALGVILSSVTKEVSAGGALHKALEKHPKVFDEIWVSLVQAGEVSGQLPTVLRQITTYNEAQENIKSKILTALAYPAVLMTMSVGVLIYFVVYIVPVFADIFRDFNLQLPLITRVIVGISGIVTKYMVFMLVVMIGAAFGFRAYIATPPGRLTWNHIQFGLPFFGGLIRSMQIERMLTTMATLIRSGVSILNSVSVLEGAFRKNLIFQNALKQAKNDIASGRSISESFKKTGIFPAMVTEMMWMGEESGKLPDIIVVLSKYYQEQIDQFIRRFSSMIDPILVVGIGGIIAVIVMSIFMPIFQLSQIGAG